MYLFDLSFSKDYMFQHIDLSFKENEFYFQIIIINEIRFQSILNQLSVKLRNMFELKKIEPDLRQALVPIK